MYEYKCKILRVIDGDTVDIDIDLGFGIWMHKERVRLFGIDTPESRTRDKEEKKYGLMSKQFVKDHLPVGSSQTLVTIKDATGKFGRILGKFKLNNNKILNEVMIEQNYAVAYHGQSKDDIQEEHLKNRKILDERINES
jgi:micrococcal nuclease